MTRDKALEILDTLLAKSSLDQELRQALSTLMDEVVVNNRKVTLLTKALAEAEDRVAALQLDLGVRDGLVTTLRPRESFAGNGQGSRTDAAVGVVGVSAVGGTRD